MVAMLPPGAIEALLKTKQLADRPVKPEEVTPFQEITKPDVASCSMWMISHSSYRVPALFSA